MRCRCRDGIQLFRANGDAFECRSPLTYVKFDGCRRQSNTAALIPFEDDVVEHAREAAVIASALMRLVNDNQVKNSQSEAHDVFQPFAKRIIASVPLSVKRLRPADFRKKFFEQAACR